MKKLHVRYILFSLMVSFGKKACGFAVLSIIFCGCFSPNYSGYSGEIEYTIIDTKFPTGITMQADAVRGTTKLNRQIPVYVTEDVKKINQYIVNSKPCFLGNSFRHRNEFDLKLESQILFFGAIDSTSIGQVLILGKKSPYERTIYIKRVAYSVEVDGGFEYKLSGCRYNDDSGFLELFTKMLGSFHESKQDVEAFEFLSKYETIYSDENSDMNLQLLLVSLLIIVIGYIGGYVSIFFIVFLLGKQNTWNRSKVKKVAIGYGLFVAGVVISSLLLR